MSAMFVYSSRAYFVECAISVRSNGEEPPVAISREIVKVKSLLSDEENCDFTFEVDGKEIYALQALLKTRSEYFRTNKC